MGFTAVRVAQRATGNLGVSASCTAGDTPSNRTVRISVTRDAQMKFFGKQIDAATDRFTVQRGTDTDKGKVAIRIDPEGDIMAQSGMHKSISFRLQAFPPVPPGRVKGTPCTLISSDKALGELIVRMPWRDGSAV